MKILQDIATAVRLTGEVRKAREAGASGVQVKPVYTVPDVRLGYWGFTPESSLFYERRWKPVRDVFKTFPEEAQYDLTFTPEDDGWTSRVELWEKSLRDALPADMYLEAMAILRDWVRRCMERRAEQLSVESRNGHH